MSNRRKAVGRNSKKQEMGRCPKCGSIHISAVLDDTKQVWCRSCDVVFPQASMA